MKNFKHIADLTITECCQQLGISTADLPEALDALKDDDVIVRQLRKLLSEDKKSFEQCSTIGQYERYLSSWTDGFYHDFARKKIAQLKAEAEEIAYFQKHKDRIWGCEAYLQKYPKGKFVEEVQSLLIQKKKVRRIRNFVLFISFAILIVFGGIYSYEPLPIINIPAEIYVSQYGDTIDFKKFMNNKINDKNLHITLHEAKTSEPNISKHSVIYRNDQKDDYILSDTAYTAPGSCEYMNTVWSSDISINRKYIIPVNASTNEIIKEVKILSVSRLFGIAFNKEIKTVKIKQAAGLAAFLDIHNIKSEWCYNVLSTNKNSDNSKTINFHVSNNGIQGNSFPVFLETDGTFVQVENSDHSWICIEKRSDNWGNNFNFHIRVSENRNSYNRIGFVTFSCGDKSIKLVLAQKSGYASYFDIEKDKLILGSKAIWEEDDSFMHYYSVKISTDGIWDFRQSNDSYSWLKAQKNVYDSEIHFQVKENDYDCYDDRLATITISTLNKGSKKISIAQHSKWREIDD